MSDGNHRKVRVPVQMIDQSEFDDQYAMMKDRFALEMKRIDDEMNKFSTDLMRLYGHTSTVQVEELTTNQVAGSPILATTWETITESPLVEDDGEIKTLKLRFDVSQYDPEQVTVRIVNDILYVSAKHEEKSDQTVVFREYNRQFQLPAGIDLETVQSSLSKDGVLIVEAPLPTLERMCSGTPSIGQCSS